MLYVVRFGQFKLIGGDQDSEQRVAGFAMAGDLLGLDAIATGRHNFRLMALENSEVCEIPYAEFSSMMNVEPTVQRQFLETISAALNDTYERSFLLAKASQDARFAGFLLMFGEKFARLGYSDESFQLSMPRSDIGSFLGTSPESVSRLIARFNAQGAVSINGRTVKVHDRSYLHYLMQGGETAAGRLQSRQAEATDGIAGSGE
jgi:CRP/FNR family transcriptional regulator